MWLETIRNTTFKICFFFISRFFGANRNKVTGWELFNCSYVWVRNSQEGGCETLIESGFGDGILGQQFNKRLESFVPCYSQSLLLADLKKTILFSSFKKQKKLREARKLEFINNIF